jgi:small conductance mechanosensitive channel
MSPDTMPDSLQRTAWVHDLSGLATWYRIGIIVVLGLVAWLAIRWVASRIRRWLVRHNPDLEHQRRVVTLVRLLRYVLGVAVFAIVLLLVLSEFGISIAPLLGAAGIAGVAIGLASQSVVKDFLRGTAILLENQIRVGDEVEVADKRGIVEEVTLRYVMLREPDGTVHFVRTGDIGTVTNHTFGGVRPAAAPKREPPL